ncbi:putative BsuMI modification methylase subunit YdiO [Deinococcus sedimenti]|uniref:DNA (cytosine-5-)-methyltransferase n=1 Tax=Deinococcus sedimenti TaxID=1867090 RepID=A0ABQ2SAK7_9DEIO|nr:putative BsuMI modification methylase subunit YdiO [Deinococcus sedimenti]
MEDGLTILEGPKRERDFEAEGNQERPQLTLFSQEQLDAHRVESFALNVDGTMLTRYVRRRDGTKRASSVRLRRPLEGDLRAAYDEAWLKSDTRPPTTNLSGQLRIVDLFSGCGGLSLGVIEAARALEMDYEVVLASDIFPSAREVYEGNIVVRRTTDEPVESLFDGALKAPLTESELALKSSLGPVDFVIGGPPCQGHSNLNNHTRRTDEKNALYIRMARVAEVLSPEHLIIENVAGVRFSKDQAFQKVWHHLRWLGYYVCTGLVYTDRIGVAQTRPRVLLLASKKQRISWDDMIEEYRTESRSFDWACADLETLGEGDYDTTRQPLPLTQQRIDYLFENDLFELPESERPECHRNGHTYNAVYGRIHGELPAPTITGGFMTMGQGRFVHPRCRRTLTPHEAARIQFIPDWFRFGKRSRKDYATLIGNAVPPKLSYVAALELMR